MTRLEASKLCSPRDTLFENLAILAKGLQGHGKVRATIPEMHRPLGKNREGPGIKTHPARLECRVLLSPKVIHSFNKRASRVRAVIAGCGRAFRPLVSVRLSVSWSSSTVPRVGPREVESRPWPPEACAGARDTGLRPSAHQGFGDRKGLESWCDRLLRSLEKVTEHFTDQRPPLQNLHDERVRCLPQELL